jgi:hypothetical protein
MSDPEQRFQAISSPGTDSREPEPGPESPEQPGPAEAEPVEGGASRRSSLGEWMPVLIALAIAALVRTGVLGRISW